MIEKVVESKTLGWVKWAKISGVSALLSLVAALIAGFIIRALGGAGIPMFIALIITIWFSVSLCAFGVCVIGFLVESVKEWANK